MLIDASSLDAFLALALGFTFAGVLGSGFELLARQPLAFGLLQRGGLPALASVPVLVFSAPLLIMRQTLRAPRNRGGRVASVLVATVFACFWSLLSGRLVLDAAHLLAGA